jgi:hypothetical protein
VSQILKRTTQMTFDELREELDAIVMTRSTERDVRVLAEAVNRLITAYKAEATERLNAALSQAATLEKQKGTK